jgi:hypothetical protein
MAVGTSSTVANAILDALLRSVAWSEPAAVYIKLHTGDPGAAGTSNAASHTARVQATFGAAAGGTATNSGEILFDPLAGTETISHWSAWDASSGGNFLFSGTLAASKSVTAGEALRFAAGDLDVSLTVIAA